MSRLGYDGVVAALPVTIPYERYSTHAAHWWLGRALGALIRQAGLAKTDVDGLCVSSFTLAPDSAVGLVQHLGMSPRWLDHIPMGGASGVAALGARAPCRPATPRSWPASRATPITWTRSATPSASSRASPRTPCIPTAPAARTPASRC